MAKSDRLQPFLDGTRIEKNVFELCPNYRAMLIAVEGLLPGPSDNVSETLLQEAEASARAKLAQSPVTDLPHISAWRGAYKAFGAKPQRTRNSLEALTRRAEAGLPRVNRLTDIYNAISVKHQIPLGGEDLDKYSGSAFLIRATGSEDFVTSSGGESVVEHPDVGEVVWCDDAGVTCRRWNWRQGPRTALTENTTSALFILDALGSLSDDELVGASDELVSTLLRICPDARTKRRLLSSSG